MMMELLRVKQSGIGGHLFRLAAWIHIHIHIHIHVQSQLQFTTQQQMQQGSLCFLRFSILLPAFRSDLSLLCLTAVAHKPKWTNIKTKKKTVCVVSFSHVTHKKHPFLPSCPPHFTQSQKNLKAKGREWICRLRRQASGSEIETEIQSLYSILFCSILFGTFSNR